jgi:hypothetical protein
MVRESQDGSLGDALGALITRAAIGAIVGAVALLGLGLVAELLRRRQRARRVLALLDLTLPIGVRTAVVSLLALLATFTGPRPVGAADSVRGWLGQVPASTTTTRPVVATPDAVAEHASPPTDPTGPVVLIPPVTVDNLDPPPAPATPTATAPPAVAPPAVAPPASAPAPVVPTPSSLPSRAYVVQRDDCLWSIAAALLGPAADARAIDIGWRQIYAANRAAIGDNPNLIHIGLTLELPPLVTQP